MGAQARHLVAQARDQVTGEGIGGVDDVAGSYDASWGLQQEWMRIGLGRGDGLDGGPGLDGEYSWELREEGLPDGRDESVGPESSASVGYGTDNLLADIEFLLELAFQQGWISGAELTSWASLLLLMV